MSNIISLILYVTALFIAACLWKLVIKPYYLYFFYSNQNIPCLGFPVPVLGNLLKVKKIIQDSNLVEKAHPFLKIHDEIF